MRKFLYSFFAVFLCWGWLGISTAQAESDPIAFMQSISDQMISGLKSKKATLKTNPSVVFSLANRIVVPEADLDAMAQRVLPPQTWNNATLAQRAQFKKEFTTLLIRTYASALAQYSDETIKFFPVRGGFAGKTSVKVDSQIVRSNAPSISVSYRLLLVGSQWKLYDMIVEGVSLLESFRSQFADILSRGDMVELNKELAAHNVRRSR
jgi:phospholipid transport system substrate-binding protein